MLQYPRGRGTAPLPGPSRPPGSTTGRNVGRPGYVHNTRTSPYDESADRHCLEPTKKGVMKCKSCFDYNSGVRRGVCKRCQFDRFSMAALERALPSLILNPAARPPMAMDLAFEERIEKYHRWSEATRKIVGAHIALVVEKVMEACLFEGKAASDVHTEGSVRKNTDVEGSDVDLMITHAKFRRMTQEERDRLVSSLRECSEVFSDVSVGPHAIKATTWEGPNIDIVAHQSHFSSYLTPASPSFVGKPSASLAVSGLKAWFFNLSHHLPSSARRELEVHKKHASSLVPGCAWEEIVLTYNHEGTGLRRFLAIIKILALDHPVVPGRGGEGYVAMSRIAALPPQMHPQVHYSAKRSFDAWNTSQKNSAADLKIAFGI